MRKSSAPSTLALAIAIMAACARNAGVEVSSLPIGTGVVVRQANGVSVAGTLIEVAPDRIVVGEQNGARHILPRRAVASVSTTEASANKTPERAAAATDADAATAAPGALSAPPPAAIAITIPARTVVPVRLESTVGSDTSHVEDPVRATVTRAVTVRGRTAIPAGAQLAGAVTSAVRPGKVKGRSRIAIRFTKLIVGDEVYAIRTAQVARSGRATKKKDAATIGIPAAGGAVVGGIIGGKKGAAIGGAAAGGAGTAVVLGTRGEEVRIHRGAVVPVRLASEVTVKG